MRAIQVMVNGTQNVLEAAVEHGVKKIAAASTASVYGDPSYLPMDETAPVQQPHPLRRGQDRQRADPARLQRDVRPALRHVPAVQRLRPAHGRLRRVHRGDDPLAGAAEPRRAAGHLRRRPPDDGLRLRRGRGRGVRQGDGRRTSATRSSTAAPASRPACATSASCSAPPLATRTSSRSSRRRAPSTTSRGGRPARSSPASASASRPARCCRRVSSKLVAGTTT